MICPLVVEHFALALAEPHARARRATKSFIFKPGVNDGNNNKSQQQQKKSSAAAKKVK